MQLSYKGLYEFDRFIGACKPFSKGKSPYLRPFNETDEKLSHMLIGFILFQYVLLGRVVCGQVGLASCRRTDHLLRVWGNIGICILLVWWACKDDA